MGERKLRWKLGLILMGGAMLSKSLIQFSVDGWGCVPSLLFTWAQTMRPKTDAEAEVMMTPFKRSHATTATLSTPNPAAGHHRPMPLLETPGHSQASLGQSLGVTAPFSWVLVHTRFCLCLPSVYFSVLCKFYGRVSGDLLQQGLCHTQVGGTQSPCPCSRPLLT